MQQRHIRPKQEAKREASGFEDVRQTRPAYGEVPPRTSTAGCSNVPSP